MFNYTGSAYILFVVDMLFKFVYTGLLAALISFTYRKLYKNDTVQEFNIILVASAILMSLLMNIFTDSILRAASILGFMLLVKNYIKSFKDALFWVFASLVGLAVGGGNETLALIASVSICFFIYFLYKIDFVKTK